MPDAERSEAIARAVSLDQAVNSLRARLTESRGATVCISHRDATLIVEYHEGLRAALRSAADEILRDA